MRNKSNVLGVRAVSVGLGLSGLYLAYLAWR